jgi:hypothetical protein
MKKYLSWLTYFVGSTITLLNPPSVSAQTYLMTYPYEVQPLPGKLNNIFVANSNSPEIIKSEGVLLSTFPKHGKTYPEAHLDMSLNGKFEIFTHHIAVEREKNDLTNVYQCLLIQNASDKEITLKINSSAKYSTGPDAGFIKLPDYVDNPQGKIFAGPGDRVSQDILREKIYQNESERSVKIPANDFYILMNDKIPISRFAHSNGKTSLFKLETDGSVYVADLAMYEKQSPISNEKIKPDLSDWLNILQNGKLADKRDFVPTPLDRPYVDRFFYSRVSGVAVGSEWKSKIINENNYFKIPEKNKGIAYALNTVYNNTYGTKQVQSGYMIKRYDDTAYQSHANYGVTYDIEIPLYNGNSESTSVAISFDSPLRTKDDKYERELTYYDEPPEKITFRGEFLVKYKSYFGIEKEKYIHVVQRFGQMGLPLASIFMEPGEKRTVNIRYIYPADCTPPHVLTITSN